MTKYLFHQHKNNNRKLKIFFMYRGRTEFRGKGKYDMNILINDQLSL